VSGGGELFQVALRCPMGTEYKEWTVWPSMRVEARPVGADVVTPLDKPQERERALRALMQCDLPQPPAPLKYIASWPGPMFSR